MPDFAAMAARGELPIALERDCARAEWTADPESVDFGRTLPLMLHGLRASDLQLRAVAEQCALDLLEACPGRAADCVPQAIPAIKRCLNTRDPDVAVRAMRVLQELATCPGAGPALRPFYRQLLPVLNIFQAKYLAGKGSRSGQPNPLGESIQEALEALELYGGEEALPALRQVMPSYESCLAPVVAQA